MLKTIVNILKKKIPDANWLLILNVKLLSQSTKDHKHSSTVMLNVGD